MSSRPPAWSSRGERVREDDEQLTPLAPARDGDINTGARHLTLQVALLVPILAGLAGLVNSLRMMRLPDPKPSSSVEGVALG
jgi:hypothetical protein